MSYLLDTNVVSELRKPTPDLGVARWFDNVDSADLFLSVLVIGEIRQGVERLRKRGDEDQSSVIESWLDVLRERFADRLLGVTAAVAECWGRLNAANPLPVVDGLLAATAIEHGLTLVTRDGRTLASSGARLLNPWQVS